MGLSRRFWPKTRAAWCALLLLLPLPAVAESPDPERRYAQAIFNGEQALLTPRGTEQATTFFDEALLAAEALEDDQKRARALTYLAVSEDLRGNHEVANAIFVEALALRGGGSLTNVQAPIAARLVQQANAYRRRGEYFFATRLYQRALMVVILPIIPEGHDPAKTLEESHVLFADPYDLGEIRSAYASLLAKQEAHFGGDHADMGWTLIVLADLAVMRGENNRAEELYKRSIDIRMRALGREDIETLQSMEALRSFYHSIGWEREAELELEYSKDAWKIWQLAPRKPTLGDRYLFARMAELGGSEVVAAEEYRHMLEAIDRELFKLDKEPNAEPGRYLTYPAMPIWLEDAASLFRRMDQPEEAEAVLAIARRLPTGSSVGARHASPEPQ